MYIPYEARCDIQELIGKFLTEIKGLEQGSDSVVFVANDGSEYTMYHDQNCCESVSINDVEGDVADLVGRPITLAEEVNSDDAPAPKSEYVDSYTWTFYRIATQKGFVVIRWLGESNGYYSESVDFAKTK